MSPISAIKNSAAVAPAEIPMLIGGEWRAKDSGIGREGARYSIRDMTEERMVLFNY